MAKRDLKNMNWGNKELPKGFEDLTIHQIAASEVMTNRNKSEKARKQSSINGKRCVENGTFGTSEIGKKGIEVQKASGWTWSKEMQEARSRGGVTGGNLAKETGQFEEFRQSGTEAGNVKRKCVHCGELADARNIGKSHNDNCKQKPEDIKKILALLPDVFKANQWRMAIKEAGFNYTDRSCNLLLYNKRYAVKTEGIGMYRKLENPIFVK